jgi:O-antigen/teichoic acid export membrane protein
MAVAFCFTLGCFLIAELMANFFNEPRVTPLMKVASLIFILSGFQIVPINLIKRKLDFKTIGFIEMTSVVTASVIMVVCAYGGHGVWSLMYGFLGRSLMRVILCYFFGKWVPGFSLNLREGADHIKFGLTVSLSRILFGLYEYSDKFFAGRSWSAKSLGYYSFALQLAQMPTEKVVSLINQVSFPAMSAMQGQSSRLNQFYLHVVKVTCVLVFPVFMSGHIMAEDLVRLFLGEKWLPITFIFAWLCLIQIVTAVNAINSYVHYSQGRALWSMYFHGICALLMPISFWWAVRFGLNAIIVPWLTVYVALCLIWIGITLKKMGISIIRYILNLKAPFFALIVLSVSMMSCELLRPHDLDCTIILAFWIAVKLIIGGGLYLIVLWILDKDLFKKVKSLIRPS